MGFFKEAFEAFLISIEVVEVEPVEDVVSSGLSAFRFAGRRYPQTLVAGHENIRDSVLHCSVFAFEILKNDAPAGGARKNKAAAGGAKAQTKRLALSSRIRVTKSNCFTAGVLLSFSSLFIAFSIMVMPW